jgi:hypothetical protein
MQAFRRRSPRGGRLSVATRDSRREENQKRFRKGNETLHDAVENVVPEDLLVRFLCECADDDCLGDVNVTLSEWESVAARPHHYLMIAGHQHSEGEQVVGRVGEYEIAQKPH